MVEKVLALAAHRNMYFGEGFDLIRPERTFIKLPENYVASPGIALSIQMGELIDWNKNILDYNPSKKDKVQVEVNLVQPASALDNIGTEKKELSEASADVNDVDSSEDTVEDNKSNGNYNKKRNR